MCIIIIITMIMVIIIIIIIIISILHFFYIKIVLNSGRLYHDLAVCIVKNQ